MTKSWLDDDRTTALIETYKKQGVYIEEKTGGFWNALAWLLCIATFGFYKREKFLKDFATTIGTKVGFPREWTYKSVEFIMPHEARHVWQGKACGLFISAWVGLPLFFLLYIVLPFPIGIAVFRYLFERDATRETLRFMKKEGDDLDTLFRFAERSAKTVASGAYIWSVPEKLAVKGYRRMVRRVYLEN